jgi:hypothetical protein
MRSGEKTAGRSGNDMSAAGVQSRPSPEAVKQALRPHLFPQDAGLNSYAVLDGASNPDLLDHLYADPRPEFVCLYRGELEPDMAEVAPYLVLLKRDHPFTEWLLAEGWGNHWGIFALSPVGLKAVRTHLRKFLMVRDPEGNQIYFRFYDPRVLRIFLPTCNAEELRALMGSLRAYLCEDARPGLMLAFSLERDQLKVGKVQIAGHPGSS